MNKDQEQMREGSGEEQTIKEGPAEKLQENNEPGSKIPGAQNPESTEIKKEKNLNTE